jgi:hypothetical protein
MWLSCCTEEIVFGYKVRRFRSASRHYVIPEPETERQFLDQFNQSDLEWSFIDWYPYQSQGSA